MTSAWREATTTGAAKLLGMSRPQVGKLINQGRLPHNLIRTHQRILMHAINALQTQSKRQHSAMTELVVRHDELRLTQRAARSPPSPRRFTS